MSSSEGRRIDIMSQYNGAFFTVDNTVETVELQQPTNSDFYILRNGSKKSFFANGDGINILSFGVKMPLGFEFYQTSDASNFFTVLHIITIADGTERFIDDLFFPFENYEMSLNLYYQDTALYGAPFKFKVAFLDNPKPKISMLNVPDKLNGKSFFVPVFFKIEHTFALTT